MSEINVSQLLSQLRSTAELARGAELRQSRSEGAADVDFSSLLKSAVDQVNESKHEAGALRKAFEVGDPNVDIAQVMIASQKAGVEFQLMLNVRNRLISAYQDIMKMAI
ncbi:MAG TPA: flagellar hook-basal body complex protein FliE [Chromatiales bacterium]|nr:flagellar hook-basal body complex protein FliE [Chromatiales bacterium]